MSLLNPQTFPRWNFSLYGSRYCLSADYLQPLACISSLHFFAHWLPEIISTWVSTRHLKCNISQREFSWFSYHQLSCKAVFSPAFPGSVMSPQRLAIRPRCHNLGSLISFGHIPPASSPTISISRTYSECVHFSPSGANNRYFSTVIILLLLVLPS